MINTCRSGKIIITHGLIILSIILSPFIILAQTGKSGDQDTVKLNKNRLIGIVAGQGAIYLGSLGGLYFVWYKNYPQSSFHFFNDDNEWQQMDKCGHTTTAYNVSRLGYESYRWSGMNESQSTWFGGLLGLAYLLNIETLDGFSKEWGFSPGDLTANVAGCLFFVGQQLAWHEQRFILKYSYHPTKYTKYNPSELGPNWAQDLIKDYNGQSYWLSCNLNSFLPKSSKFPKWFNIAFGYGAEGMTGAAINPKQVNNMPIPDFTRYHKFYISLDADLTRIPTKSKVLKGIFTVLGFIKIPSPSIEFNTLGKLKVYPLYF
ncbi:MAG: DUF2279 domain-containing protein [Bacteroidales bacterium]|jgi:hypothetical protein